MGLANAPESMIVLEQEQQILTGEAGRLGWELLMPIICNAGVSEALVLGTI